jgi:protein-disulfide isomerase
MHELLFEKAQEWSGQSNLTERFTGYAADLGLDTDAFVACLEAGETAAQVQAELERGEALGVQGVPAFFINDWFVSGAQPFEAFQEAIENALAGKHPPPTPTPLPAGATPFDPDPARPGYTYGGDATHGSAEAEIVLVEFVDFQSPENRTHVLDVWPDVEKTYVEPGKVRLVVKHFPAADHAPAFQAAEAAECAGQQEAFWAMYDLLFQRQEEWSQEEDVSATLKGYAAELGLDAGAFAACLDEGQTGDKVSQDFTIGQENQFPPAPQFFIISGERGIYVPSDTLQETIEQLLAEPGGE